MIVGQGPIALVVGADRSCMDIFTLLYPFFPLSPAVWETARYRLKYCLKRPLNPKQQGSQFPIPGSRFPIPGFWFLIPGSRSPIPGSRFPVPDSWSRLLIVGSWFPVFSLWLPIPGSRFLVPGSRFLVPGSRFSVKQVQNEDPLEARNKAKKRK